jgi:FMN phosphatase YigB (HAD superfamily)
MSQNNSLTKNVVILVDFDYTLFDTAKFVEFLSNSPKTINYKDFLFSDALEFISYASSFGNLVLFSEGDVNFQKEKITGTGIGKLFSGGVKIFSSFSKMEDLSNVVTSQKVILIDDKPGVIDKGIFMGYSTIRIRRGKYANKETKNKPDFVVDNLSNLVTKDLLRII